jgi:hypothetical protein
MTSSQHGLYIQGYTHATMDRTVGSEAATRSGSFKAVRSSDCRLQLACMKSELLVTANQHVAVNTFPGLVHTARHVMRAGHA